MLGFDGPSSTLVQVRLDEVPFVRMRSIPRVHPRALGMKRFRRNLRHSEDGQPVAELARPRSSLEASAGWRTSTRTASGGVNTARPVAGPTNEPRPDLKSPPASPVWWRRPVRLRGTKLALLLVAAAVLASGCGSGSVGAAGPASERASASNDASAVVGSALSAHTQYADFAESVDLHLADVPGFAPQPGEAKHPGSGHAISRAFFRCVGPHFAGLRKTTRPILERSAAYQSGAGLNEETVTSTVNIEPSVRDVRREGTELRSLLGNSAARGCFSQAMGTLFAQNDNVFHTRGVTVRVRFNGTRLAPAELGSTMKGTDVSGGFATTTTVTYIATGRRRVTVPVPLYLDLFFFGVGRADVGLTTPGQ